MSVLSNVAIDSWQSIRHYRFQARLLQSCGLILETSLQAFDRLHQHLSPQLGQLVLKLDVRVLSVYARVCGQPFLPKLCHLLFQGSSRVVCRKRYEHLFKLVLFTVDVIIIVIGVAYRYRQWWYPRPSFSR